LELMSHRAVAKYVGESGLATSNRILGASRTVSRFYGRHNPSSAHHFKPG
jgi:hypothetical protein